MGIYEGENNKLTRNNRYNQRKSFEDIGKNLNLISRRMMQNERLVKLLVYTTPDAEEKTLEQEQIEAVFGDQIKIVPVIDKEEEIKNYVIVQFGAFTPVEKTDYKNYVISFDIICNTANWMMKDYTPRPYKIMQEIDTMFNATKLESIGPVTFMGAQSLVINEEMSGFTINYLVMVEQ